MADAKPEVTIEMLEAFADAWNRHDVDALMSFMAEDCAFRVEVHGCDLFTFRDGKISLKNSYRKSRPAQGAPKR